MSKETAFANFIRANRMKKDLPVIVNSDLPWTKSYERVKQIRAMNPMGTLRFWGIDWNRAAEAAKYGNPKTK